MKKTVFILITFFVCFTGFGQQHHLVVNPKGHKGQIRDIVVSNDGKYIISGSFDKRIKKWDIETGEVVMEYNSQIGVGSEGMVYFIELSPDGKYLAAGGWFGPDDESEDLGDIRVFDYETGKIISVLKGLGSSPVGLGFSADSKQLISADIYSKIYKWDVHTGNKLLTFDFHVFEEGKTLTEISSNSNRIMSLDEAGNLCFWDVNKNKKPLKIDNKTLPEVASLGLKNIGTPGNLAISPTLKDYAFSIENFIVLLNDKYEAYFIIENKYKPGFLKFSKDGNRLLTGCVARGLEQHAYVFEKQKNGDWIEICDFVDSDASMICGDFLTDDKFVTAGGSNNSIFIWSSEKHEDGKQKLIKELKNNCASPYSVALNGNTIAYSNVWTENFGLSKFNKQFDLFLKETDDFQSTLDFNKPKNTYKDYSIKWSRVGRGLDGLTQGLEIKKGNQVIDTIKRDIFSGSRHTVYGFSDNGFILSGGNYGFLIAYDKLGRQTNRLVGHEDIMEGFSISADGKRLITASDDNTIKIWSLEKLGMDNPDGIPFSIVEYVEKEWGKNNDLLPWIKKYKLTEKANERTFEAWQYVIDEFSKTEISDVMPFFQDILNDCRSSNIFPIVSIFISNDGEWVIWNNEGYFTSSKDGAKYIGYHVNQGKDKEAKYYPFEQFDLKYNRPDIILKDLSLGNSRIIEFYYKAYQKRLKKMGITEAQLSNDIHLPKIQINSHVISEDKKSVELSVKAFDSKYDLDRINIYLNDVPVFGSAGISVSGKEFNKKISLELSSGKNTIQVSVLNEKGAESLKENFFILTPKSNQKPNLYLISIGTSHYSDERFDLKYAAKDAHDITTTFAENDIYSNVFYKELTNEKATKENILSLKEFLSKSERDDVVMVFIAGHGLLDENYDYFYATYDIDFNKPALNGMLYAEIENLLDGLKALKKLLFMDTCHSGEVDKDDVEESKEKVIVEEDVTFRNAGLNVRSKTGVGLENTSELVKQLFTDLRKGTGTTVISSAGGAEYAMESDDWENGLFTFCFINGLKNGSSDLDKNGEVLLSEFQQYIQNEVFNMSNGKQNPTSRIENIKLDYPLWNNSLK